jgi:biotin operon repressor
VTGAPFRHVWERVLRDARLTPSAALVGLVLATYGNGDGTSIHPGEVRLAEGLGVSRSTVARAMKTLRNEGYIERVREGNARRGHADEYRLALPPDHVSPAVDHVSPEGDHVSPGTDHVSPVHGSRSAHDSPQSQVPGHLHQVIYTDTSTPGHPVDDGGRDDPWAEAEATEPTVRAVAESVEVEVEVETPHMPDVEVESSVAPDGAYKRSRYGGERSRSYAPAWRR